MRERYLPFSLLNFTYVELRGSPEPPQTPRKPSKRQRMKALAKISADKRASAKLTGSLNCESCGESLLSHIGVFLTP